MHKHTSNALHISNACIDKTTELFVLSKKTNTNARINKRNCLQHSPDNLPQGVGERIGTQYIFSFSRGRGEIVGTLRNELAVCGVR